MVSVDLVVSGDHFIERKHTGITELPHPACPRRPLAIEMLKFGWIQWLATFIVLWYLIQWAEWFVFVFRLVETRIVSDFQPRKQRF